MSQRCRGRTRNAQRCRNLAADSTGFCRSHHPDPAFRQSSGGDFEKQVLSILRLLGYSVERNVTLNGCQIDLLAIYHTGVIPLRLMVECKDYDHPVGIEEVKAFAGSLAPASGRAVDKGLIVAKSGFTREAKELAQSCGIQPVTYADLSTALVDFDGYISQVIREFDQLPVASSYIELSGTDTENYEGADDMVVRTPLTKLVDEYFRQPDGSKLALLGNFGTGKTTFCRKYARDLAKAYQSDPTGRIPIVVNLRDFDARLDIQELVTNTLQFRYGVRIDIAVSRELQRLGRFLMLFDGFDEMATRVDPDTVRENLREIQKIAEIPQNQFLLTCRTHFFKDRVQATVLANFEIAYVPEWGEAELEEYLKKRCGMTWQDQLRQIHGTHDLAELAQTPLFLEMIVDSLPKLGNDVRRSDLYNSYTSNWIEEQSKRRGARLDPIARRQFVSELAMILYRDNKSSCHYREFVPILRKRFEVDDAAEMDHLQSDVRTCTFLVRDPAGHYAFRHKSFMEFFVASSLAARVRSGDIADIGCRPLPSEVRTFLAELLRSDPPEQVLKEWVRSGAEQILRDNALALINDLRIDLADLRIEQNDEKDEEAKAVSGFVRGEQKAFDWVWAHYRPAMVKYAYRICKDQREAEDIVAEAMLKAWERRAQIDINNLRGYLFGTTKYTMLDRRRSRSHPWASIADIDPREIEDEKASEAFERAEKRQTLSMAIAQLSEREASVIKAVAEDMTSGEIAKRLGLTVATVSRIRYNAMKKLRRLLAEMGYERNRRGVE